MEAILVLLLIANSFNRSPSDSHRIFFAGEETLGGALAGGVAGGTLLLAVTALVAFLVTRPRRTRRDGEVGELKLAYFFNREAI